MTWLSVLGVIKSGFSFLIDPKNRTVVLILAIAILSFLLFNKCNESNKLKTEMAVKTQNIEALNDSVKTVKNKAGELQQEKLALISTGDNLRGLNVSLNDEVKKQKGNVIYISEMNAELKNKNGKLEKENKSLRDSLKTHITANGDTVNTIYWDFSKVYDKNNSRTIIGNTNFSLKGKKITPQGSELTNYGFKLNITTGLSEDKDKKLKIWVKTDYPDLTFSNINGALVDPTDSDVLKTLMPQNRWVFGPQAGFGVGYFSGQVKPTVYIGFGVEYRFFGFK